MSKNNVKRENFDDLMNGFDEVCKSKGLRVTHQRTEIFREMARYYGHPSAEMVYEKVRRRLKTISLDTVYRTILTFEKHGLIKRVQILDNAARFDINLSVHHHLVCAVCKKIDDFYWPAFDKMTPPRTLNGWSQISSKHVEIRGLCKDCRDKQK